MWSTECPKSERKLMIRVSEPIWSDGKTLCCICNYKGERWKVNFGLITSLNAGTFKDRDKQKNIEAAVQPEWTVEAVRREQLITLKVTEASIFPDQRLRWFLNVLWGVCQTVTLMKSPKECIYKLTQCIPVSRFV